ncbi:hypothetical protein Tco_1488480, partial [Tanacetum coccineum]
LKTALLRVVLLEGQPPLATRQPQWVWPGGSKFNEIGTRPLLNDALDTFDK